MTPNMTPIRIEAQVEAHEQACVISGIKQLREALVAVSPGEPHSFEINFQPPRRLDSLSPVPEVVILSLSHQLRAEPIGMPEIRKQWVEHISTMVESGAAVFMLNIFRHVDKQAYPDSRAVIIEKIRRLNLMAIGLSHELGIGIIDVDRVMAHFGGRNLNTDFRLAGDFSANVGGHTLASALLAFGLDRAIDCSLQEKALLALGNVKITPLIVQSYQAQQGLGECANG